MDTEKTNTSASELSNAEKAPPTDMVSYPRGGRFNSKSVAFVGIISALGAVLSLSTMALPIGFNTSLDFSHIGTFIVAIGGGPILGSITGSIAGIFPAFSFSNPGLIPGKMLTGFSVGAVYLLFKRLRPAAFETFESQTGDSTKAANFFSRHKFAEYRFLSLVCAGILGYIPEYIFTIWDLNFITQLPAFVISGILIKAWVEIVLISIITALLYSNRAIFEGVKQLIGKVASLGSVEYAASGVVIVITLLFLTGIYLPALQQSSILITDVLVGILFGLLGVLICFLALKLRKESNGKRAKA